MQYTMAAASKSAQTLRADISVNVGWDMKVGKQVPTVFLTDVLVSKHTALNFASVIHESA